MGDVACSAREALTAGETLYRADPQGMDELPHYTCHLYAKFRKATLTVLLGTNMLFYFQSRSDLQKSTLIS